MIFIDNKEVNVVYFPKNYEKLDKNKVNIKLYSELSLKEYVFNDVEDISDNSDYYKVVIDFTNIEKGEYIYKVNDGIWTSTGLLRLGKIDNTNLKNYEDLKTIKEYRYG